MKTEAQRRANKAWVAKNPDQYNAAKRKLAKKRYAENPEKYRVLSRKYRGLPEPTRPTPDLCECCGSPPGQKGMALDHCHKTNVFRGWLCSKCNAAIGSLGDTVAGVLRAIRYLETPCNT